MAAMTEKETKSSTKLYYTENERLRNTNTTQNRDKPRCSGRIGSSCSTSDTRCVIVLNDNNIM
jgi:hypothetical protein